MAKALRHKEAKPPRGKKARRAALSQGENVVAFEPLARTNHPPHQPTRLVYRSQAQGHYHQAIQTHTLTLGIGPAGCGKTAVCVLHGARLLAEKKISRLIVTRPIVEAGESLGFLPGTADEKTDPYFAPVREMLSAYFGQSHLELLLKRGYVTFTPLAFLRGVTFDDAFVIADEFQNTTPTQLKLFLSRIGEHCTVVVNGDVDQKDIQGKSGLEDAVERLEGMEGVCVYAFQEEDIVRSKFCKELMCRYRSTR